MCQITTLGYKMSDGTLIPFKNLEIQNIPVHHIEELNNASASAWEIVLLRNSMEDMKEEILEKNKSHTDTCPINKTRVVEIVNEEIKKIPGKTLTVTSRIANHFNKILLLGLTLATIYNMIK